METADMKKPEAKTDMKKPSDGKKPSEAQAPEPTAPPLTVLVQLVEGPAGTKLVIHDRLPHKRALSLLASAIEDLRTHVVLAELKSKLM